MILKLITLIGGKKLIKYIWVGIIKKELDEMVAKSKTKIDDNTLAVIDQLIEDICK